MPTSKSTSTPQLVTLQVACGKTSWEEKTKPRVENVTELALVILGIGCVLTMSATGIAFYARGELGSGLPKVFSGFGSALPMSDFLFGTPSESQPESIFANRPQDLHSQEPLPIALASPSNSITTVIRHGLSGSKPVRKKGLSSWGAAYEQAAPPENLSKPRDVALPVTTISPSMASERAPGEGLAALAPPPALAVVEELQSWFGSGHPFLKSSLGDLKDWCLLKQAFMIFVVVVAFSGLSLGLNSVVRKGKSSARTLDIESDHASAKLPLTLALPTDNDIMEAFDAYDRNRMGFIDRATVNHMLGHMALPGHRDAAGPSVKKLFYDDFRRLAQSPGPFADLVMERVRRREKRSMSDCKRAASFDERCKLGADVDAMEGAIPVIKVIDTVICQSPLVPQDCANHGMTSTPGVRRSWDELRADLAPKPLPDSSKETAEIAESL